MAVKVPQSFNYVPAFNGDEGLVLPYREANSQVFVKGDLVVQNAAGDISLCGADPANILGIALQPATNVTSGNKLISVQVIRSFDLYIAHLIAAFTFTLTDTGTIREIVRTAAGNWQVDSTQAANTSRVKLVGPMEYTADALLNASAGGAVYVRFLSLDGTTVNILQYESNVGI